MPRMNSGGATGVLRTFRAYNQLSHAASRVLGMLVKVIAAARPQ
jgi:hypothetical protein